MPETAKCSWDGGDGRDLEFRRGAEAWEFRDEPDGPEWYMPPGMGAAIWGRSATSPTGDHYAEITHRTLSNLFAPAAVLTDRKGTLRYFTGPIHRYFHLPASRVASNVVGMARDGLKGKLQMLIHQAARIEAEKITLTARVRRDWATAIVRLSLFRIAEPNRRETLLLVCLADED